MKIITTMLAAALLFTACEKNKEDAVTANGVVITAENSVCPVMINLDNGIKIAPLNTESENVGPLLINNLRVSVTYRVDNDFITPCEGAKPAEIVKIQSIGNSDN